VSTPDEILAHYLKALCPGRRPFSFGQIAEGIIADPQAYVDALVAAGVLERYWPPEDGAYRIPKPHVHDWKFTGSARAPSMDRYLAYWSCRSCPETATRGIEPPS